MSHRKGGEGNRKAFFTAEEFEKLLHSFLQSRGHAGATEEEIKQLFHKLAEIRVAGLSLQLAIDGRLHIDWLPDEQNVGFWASSPAPQIH